VSIPRPVASSSPEVVRRLGGPSRHGAEPRSVGLATVTMVLCLALLVGLTLLGPRLAERMSSPIAAKLTDAERVVYYMVDDDRGPSFRLSAGDHTIKLITHLLLPPDTRYDPDQDYAYGLLLILRELDGREIARHELNIRTRQSKSGPAGFGWRHENAFMLGDDRELTDDRLTRVRLPESSGDRMLELRLIPRIPSAEVSALARVYARRPQSVDERMLREFALAPEAGRALVERLTYRDWHQLSDDERKVKLSSVWARLAAAGSPGRDYHALSIYETGFRLPRRTQTDQRRLEVDRWRSLAINLLGPAELELRLFGDPLAIAGLEVHGVGLDGRVSTHAGDAAVRTLMIPAGLHTLILGSEQRLELELEVSDAETDRVWFSEADRPTRRNEAGNEVLEPDYRRVDLARVGPWWPEPPRWSVVGPADAISRIFRFDVRVATDVPSSWWAERGPRPSLEVCFLDDEDRELRCDRWRGRPAIGSRFEGLREDQDDPELRAPRWYVVSEPQTLRVIAPANAASIELRSGEGHDQRLLVRGYGYWPEVATELAEPFASYEPELARWRYPPFDLRTWFPLRPTNFDALQDARAIAELHAQVRLQPRGRWRGPGQGRWDGDPDFDDRLANLLAGADGWDPGPWVTLEPRGVHRRRSILERLDDDAARRLLDRWDPSLLTKLVVGRTLVVDLSAASPGPPELHWRVDPRTLGRTMTVRVDDRSFTRKLTATRGRWRLPVTDGRRRLTVEIDDPLGGHDVGGHEVWLDRPVLVASPPVSRRRTIHELTTKLRFPLVKPSVEALTVNLVVYLPRQRERAELALTVDDGEPLRLTGVVGERVSVAARRFSIDSEQALDAHQRPVNSRDAIRYVELDTRRGLPLDAVTVQITLGEDVAPGRHEVRVELLDDERGLGRGRVWVRAFHRGVASRSLPATSWTEAVEEDPQ
jgi:hypothetical protein